ncbi:Phosphopantothenoylcysteine decarboxylase [Anabarilius grahami]|uniref:Phosphopantothenoylcysteine decarboxylase n=1 Tax=Anabarilius grahami TaxID=495550 RepID=A0A3N0YAM7_ANAGA|nr:Phosphopantothenoylcysteine decarboxylase [Anabarilius grahami]
MQQQDSDSDHKQLELQTNSTKFHVLVGLTGSVAALKAPLLVTQLLEIPGVDVRVVTTDHATHFYDISEVPVCVYRDKDEWEIWTKRSDPVLHIELRRWADLLVIAPLDANTLGKIASGICDNLLTCVVRAWDTSRPLLFCPAMNTAMWNHPVTAQQVATLKGFGYVEIPCIAKKLVCGEEGTKYHVILGQFNPQTRKTTRGNSVKVAQFHGKTVDLATLIISIFGIVV